MEAILVSPMGRITLGTAILTIGRAQDNQLVVNDPQASAHHAEIQPTADGQGYQITDLGSTNGTFVNEQRLDRTATRLLNAGDTIRIGETTFTYEAGGVSELVPTIYANPGQGSDPGYPPTVAVAPPSVTAYGWKAQQGYPPSPPDYSPYEPPVQPPYVPPQSYEQLLSAPPPPPPYTPPPQQKKKLGGGLRIVLIALAVLVVLGMVVVLWPSRSANQGGNSSLGPPDNTNFTVEATIQARNATTGKQLNPWNETLIITGHTDGGSVCESIDDGQPHTMTGHLTNGIAYTKTMVFNCSGTYKGGKLSYTETVTSLRYITSDGDTCQLNTSFVYDHLEGTFSNQNTISGTYSAEASSVPCSSGGSIGIDAKTGTWTGTSS